MIIYNTVFYIEENEHSGFEVYSHTTEEAAKATLLDNVENYEKYTDSKFIELDGMLVLDTDKVEIRATIQKNEI